MQPSKMLAIYRQYNPTITRCVGQNSFIRIALIPFTVFINCQNIMA